MKCNINPVEVKVESVMQPPSPPAPTDAVRVNGVTFTHADLHRVVDLFYARVQEDPVLRVPFLSVHDWPEHVSRLTHFWWIRFGGEPYQWSLYNPVAKHFHAGFNAELLARWLELFRRTLHECLDPEPAALWSAIAGRMGEALSAKNEAYRRQHDGDPV